MSRRRKIIKWWLFINFDVLVYIGSFLVAVGWIYSVKAQYDYKQQHRKPVTPIDEEAVELSGTEKYDGVSGLQMMFILLWVEPYTLRPFHYEGQTDFLKHNCKFNQCFVTHKKNLLRSVAEFDLILFHGPTLVVHGMKMPTFRDWRQKYVFYSLDSSIKYPVCHDMYNKFFNWTWTTRFESDYTCGYITIKDETGKVVGPNNTMAWIDVPSMEPIDFTLKRKLASKTKAAMGIVLDCRRWYEVQAVLKNIRLELKEYALEIDMYGCDQISDCDPSNASCLEMIQNQYHFYIAIEDPLREDHASKNLLIALQNYAVPIVFGETNYKRFMPDGIYLDGGKLTPKALAKEMSDIIGNKERYYRFFKWHNHYSYHARDESPDTDDICKMCELMHNEQLMRTSTTYETFRQWWNMPGSCRGRKK